MTTLTNALSEALAARYPSVTVSSRSHFLPMLDLSKGELSSTAAIEVARALRGDALEIAAQLVADISKRVSGEWNVVAGYIVLSDSPLEILREEALSQEPLTSRRADKGSERSVICLVPDSTTPIYARLRLIACAALQSLLTISFEGRCRVGFEPDAPTVVSSSEELVRLVSRAVERCLGNEGESRLAFDFPSSLLSASTPLTVWTSHHYHDRLSKEVKQAFVEARLAGTGVLKIPSDGWLLSRERALSDLLSAGALTKVIGRLSGKESWLRWIHHFASSIPSGDLDPSVSLYDECASPRWTLQILHQRVSQLLSSRTLGGERDLVAQVVSAPLPDRALLIRALFLPLITGRAIFEGEVLAWSALAEEFASRAHAILNSPHFRRSLEDELLPERLMQINAGLVLGIVGILPAISED